MTMEGTMMEEKVEDSIDVGEASEATSVATESSLMDVPKTDFPGFLSSGDPLSALFYDFAAIPSSFGPMAAMNQRISLDVKENKDEYVILADLPGVSTEDMKVQVESERTIAIIAERKEVFGTEGDDVRRREVHYGKKLRRFKLPSNADSQRIQAKLEKGVLTLTVAKKEESEDLTRTVEVVDGDAENF